MAKLGTVDSDCHSPKMDFFETCGSLEFSFMPPPPWCHESTAEVLVTARVGGEPLMLCSTTGADMLRVQTVLGGSSGDVDGVGGSHPLLFSKERHRQFIIEFCCSL